MKKYTFPYAWDFIVHIGMKKTFIYISSQMFLPIVYWLTIAGIGHLSPFIYSYIDQYMMFVYVILVVVLFVYYLIKVFPQEHILYGVFTIGISVFPLYFFSFFAFDFSFFDISQVLARCDNGEYIYSYIDSLSGSDDMYTRRSGLLPSDGLFKARKYPANEVEITMYDRDDFTMYQSCLENAGYTVKLTDLGA